MTRLPEISFLDQPRTEGELKNQFFGKMIDALTETLGGAPVTRLSISSGALSPVAAVHAIDTEGGTPSDDLEKIAVTNHPEGRIIIVFCADNARSVTVKHALGGLGQILLNDAQDLQLTDVRDRLFLQRIGENWEELFRTGPSFLGEPADPDIVKAPGGVLPALDGGALTGLPIPDSVPSWLVQSTMRNTMKRLVDENLSSFGLSGMGVDEFIDETGVDAVASVGAQFLNGAYSGLYRDPTERVEPSYGHLSFSSQYGATAENARDNNTVSTGWNTNAVGAAWWRLDFTEDKYFWKYGMFVSTDGRYLASSMRFDYLDSDGVTWVSGSLIPKSQLPQGTQCEFEVEGGTTPSTRSIRFYVWRDSVNVIPHQFYLYEAVVNDMELVSSSYAAASSPDAATILTRCSTDGVLGTDLRAFASRDNGVTWSEGSLRKIAEEGKIDYYEAVVDLSGQPTGTDMKWKITTHNLVVSTVEAVALMWS